MSWYRTLLMGSACVAGVSAIATVSVAQTADTVRGVVYDSLLKAPLQGATVVGQLSDAGASARSVSAITDADGGFVLIAEHRINRLTVYHDDFERIGLSALESTRGGQRDPVAGEHRDTVVEHPLVAPL